MGETSPMLPPIGHYSPVVLVPSVAHIAYVSGQLPVDPATGLIAAGDVVTQARQAIANALSLLASVGGRPTDIAKVTIFTTDLGSYADLDRTYAEALGDSRPARSIVEVSGLPRGAMVVIELTAAILDDSTSNADPIAREP
jgi:2-iminobutanoate/2-iminopropanoate deaminase